MELADHLRHALRTRARHQHAAASTYFADEVAPAFADVRGALGELDVPCDLEVGSREGRLQLPDGQSLRLTLHTDADRCDLWAESQAFPSFVDTKLWSRRWCLGRVPGWPRDRLVDLIADWIAALPTLPEEVDVDAAASG